MFPLRSTHAYVADVHKRGSALNMFPPQWRKDPDTALRIKEVEKNIWRRTISSASDLSSVLAAAKSEREREARRGGGPWIFGGWLRGGVSGVMKMWKRKAKCTHPILLELDKSGLASWLI